MKIIKFKKREKFKYKRKVVIKDLILNISIGIHNFEKRKKQRVKFNIKILTDPLLKPNSNDLSTILNYENIDNVKIEDDNLIINNEIVSKYTFKQDYYFMMGDNRHNSEDSRFWGFVPYDHILGEASFIWFSYNYQEDNLFSAIRWNRFLKVIK